MSWGAARRDHVVLAIDGGNSKTDVVLVSASGEIIAHRRGPGSSPHALGIEGCVRLLDSLVSAVAAEAGVTDSRGVAHHASVYLAGVDVPAEARRLREAITARAWGDSTVVGNDTFALLRAGTDERDAVAVVCGAGTNCAGTTRGGGVVRFLSLGRISGDWGGGVQLGEDALFRAARAVDGRGPATVLVERIVEHFGRRRLTDVIEDLHFSHMPHARLGELAPMVLRAASRDGDEVAASIVARQAEEVVLYAATALRRLDLTGTHATVVLGGGVLTSRDPLLHGLIATQLAEVDESARVVITEVAPVVGAALLGLDRLQANESTKRRLRESLVITRTDPSSQEPHATVAGP